MIYFSLLILFIFLISTAYYSYAFFTHQIEEHGKLNLVVGTLDYQLESKDLKNNQIIVSAKETIKIPITVVSLNSIDSKYQLYYLENHSIEVGYLNGQYNPAKGVINANSESNIEVVILNNSNTDQVVTFGVIGGFKTNELILDKGVPIPEMSAYEITNLVQNGSFENVSEDQLSAPPWIFTSGILNHDTMKYRSNYNLYCNDTSTTAHCWNKQTISINKNEVVYISVIAYYILGTEGGVVAITNTSSLKSRSLPFQTDTKDKWIRNTFITTTPDFMDNLQIGTSAGKTGTVYIDEIMIVNLTEVFGSGNEPDKEWCDNHIDYFEGTTIVYK